MDEYEYEAIVMTGRPLELQAQVLSRYGGEGWQLVTVDNGIAYLEREVTAKPDAGSLLPALRVLAADEERQYG